VKTAVARFGSNHPYLLFGKFATSWIRDRANSHQKLVARLKASLDAAGTASLKSELRSRIKRQSRHLIHTAFLAVISDRETKVGALGATRAASAGAGCRAELESPAGHPILSILCRDRGCGLSRL